MKKNSLNLENRNIERNKTKSTFSASPVLEFPEDVLDLAVIFNNPVAHPLNPDEDSSTPDFLRSSFEKSITVAIIRRISRRFLDDGAEK